ncbi:uncharacterized protein LOC119403348 [Rhipicephalus sanguineus]|uniref:uncharacterized protein LOC119403348 n=1 Tax=Rhipicephalus sanguineus TaxID=34632 RepID=UPI001894B3D8|nr:uncharacterized protein LOC119403348 [Rhipicephalus sanguineus]
MAPLRKTGSYCCVVDCHNSTVNTKGLIPTVKFYRFPKRWHERDRRQAWITAVRRRNADGSAWYPADSALICSRHFVGNCKNDSSKHPSYLPTIFPAVYNKRPPDAEATHRCKLHAWTAACSAQNSVEQAVPQSIQVDPAMQDQDTPVCLSFHGTLSNDAEILGLPLATIRNDDPQPSAALCETIRPAFSATQADAVSV